MTAMRLPSFLLAGAHKAGTTALHDILGQHPEIFMSARKEPRFFALEGDPLDYRGPDDPAARAAFTTIEAYAALFADSAGYSAVGESSTLYLYDDRAAANIARHCPAMKIVVVLRDPVDRAYSNFIYNRRDGREPLASFVDALTAEDDRVVAKWGPLWHYRRKGHYLSQLQRYYAHFPPEQLLVLLYDHLVASPADTAVRIFRFLGVDPTASVDVRRRLNVSGVPRVASLQRAMKGGSPVKRLLRQLLPRGMRKAAGAAVARANLASAPPMPEAARVFLDAAYAGEREALESTLGCSLQHWRSHQLRPGTA
jgi:hypothetical protein